MAVKRAIGPVVFDRFSAEQVRQLAAARITALAVRELVEPQRQEAGLRICLGRRPPMYRRRYICAGEFCVWLVLLVMPMTQIGLGESEAQSRPQPRLGAAAQAKLPNLAEDGAAAHTKFASDDRRRHAVNNPPLAQTRNAVIRPGSCLLVFRQSRCGVRQGGHVKITPGENETLHAAKPLAKS